MTSQTTKDSIEVNNVVPLIDKDRKLELVFNYILVFGYFHVGGLIGLYVCFTTAQWFTLAWGVLLYVFGMLGITAGVHRLWAHKSYKAKLPLELLLIVFNSLASQYSAFYWARDHRVHHKFCDTEADPHNSRRGLFYSHIGWLLVKKGEQSKKQGKKVNVDDLYANKIIMFQKKYSLPVIFTIGYVLPTMIPVYFWGESTWNAWHVNMLRVALCLNVVGLVNSYAHAFGYQPYDTNSSARQKIGVSVATLGESFHNFHHTFPWDYRAAELGNNYFNLTTKFIDFFAWIGWAYDLKSATNDMIEAKMLRSGDGKDLWGHKKTDQLKDKENKLNKD